MDNNTTPGTAVKLKISIILEPYSQVRFLTEKPGLRSRSKFTEFQVNVLEQAYARNKTLYHGRKQVIAEEADLTGTQVQTWFNNKRQRESKLMNTPKKPSSK